MSNKVQSADHYGLSDSLFDFTHSVMSFVFPFSLTFTLTSGFSFSTGESLVLALCFFGYPRGFSVYKGRFFDVRETSSFFFPTFDKLVPSETTSVTLTYLRERATYLGDQIKVYFQPILLTLSPHSGSKCFAAV